MKFLKILVRTLVPFALLVSSVNSSEPLEKQRENLNLWKVQIASAKAEPPNKAIPILARCVVKMTKPAIFQIEEKWEVYREAQSQLLSIPGHAQYYADEIEKLRKMEDGIPRVNQISYDYYRYMYLGETLVHLPSPETIEVLGKYLEDERDPPPEAGFTVENAYLATFALSRIGLRDAPAPPLTTARRITGVPDRENARQNFRKWFAAVQFGERAFSFVGQNVEHRFKPDGTVETTPLKREPSSRQPDQGLDSPNGIRNISGAEPRSAADPAPSTPWPWIASGVLILLAFAGFLALRMKSR